jgi:hypothetical protein
MSKTVNVYTKEQIDNYIGKYGTFTPYFFDDGSGNAWPGATTDSGTYIRIGKLIHIFGYCTYSAKDTNAAGTIRVRNFPFESIIDNIGIPNVDYGDVIPQKYRIRMSHTDLLFYDDAGALQGNSLRDAMPSSGTFHFNFTIMIKL